MENNNSNNNGAMAMITTMMIMVFSFSFVSYFEIPVPPHLVHGLGLIVPLTFFLWALSTKLLQFNDSVIVPALEWIFSLAWRCVCYIYTVAMSIVAFATTLLVGTIKIKVPTILTTPSAVNAMARIGLLSILSGLGLVIHFTTDLPLSVRLLMMSLLIIVYVILLGLFWKFSTNRDTNLKLVWLDEGQSLAVLQHMGTAMRVANDDGENDKAKHVQKTIKHIKDQVDARKQWEDANRRGDHAMPRKYAEDIREFND